MTMARILDKVESFASQAIHGLAKEDNLLQTLHNDVKSALGRTQAAPDRD